MCGLEMLYATRHESGGNVHPRDIGMQCVHNKIWQLLCIGTCLLSMRGMIFDKLWLVVIVNDSK
jgi:hypothetical protein